MRAFAHLQTCRPAGFGMMPIPWRDVVAYADEAGLEGEAREVFADVIGELDAEVLEEERARRAKEAPRHGR